MPRFSANLSMLFSEVDFLNRFELAAKAGFKGVEFQYPYHWEKEKIAGKLEEFKLTQVLFNLPSGNAEKGERGLACLPDRVNEFKNNVGLAIEYAKAFRCNQINCILGIIPNNVPLEKVHQTLFDNLNFAVDTMEKAGITLLIEALNSYDVPGFYLVHTSDAIQLFHTIQKNNIKFQYDVYHMQIMEGNLISTISRNISDIGHIQIADNPGRHEPGTGEINFNNLFKAIDETGYTGWVGCEYNPIGKTEDGLSWLKPYIN